MLKRHHITAFFILAFLLSWYPYLLGKFGVPTSGGINPLGPLVAGIILTALLEGRKGLKQYFSRIVRWRVEGKWYLIVFFLPIVMNVVSAAVILLAGAPFPTGESIRNWKGLPEQFLFTFLFVGLGEEPGWRGYALEHMQKKKSSFVASTILAVVWAAWHFPLMGTEFQPMVIPAFLINVFAATYVITWIYNRTNGSVLLTMILHAMVNTVGAGYVFQMFTGTDVVRLWYVYSTIWILVAAVVVAKSFVKFDQISTALDTVLLARIGVLR